MNFEDIKTQEDFDNAIQSAVTEATAGFSDYDELKGSLSVMTTENTDLKSQFENLREQLSEKDGLLTSAQAELKKIEIGRTKERIAIDHGLPLNIANRITGETLEEMQADAKELAKFFKQKAPTIDNETPSDSKKAGLSDMLSKLGF